eukprot:9251801-Heterocapsa_arctica.AAC.1
MAAVAVSAAPEFHKLNSESDATGMSDGAASASGVNPRAAAPSPGGAGLGERSPAARTPRRGVPAPETP